MVKSLLTFSIDIITRVISSTQIACDVMYVQHVIQKFLYSLQKKTIFLYKEFFSCRSWFLLKKIKVVFHI